MPFDKTKITKDMLEKAAKCETADELIALAKRAGIELTKAEAEAYMAELNNVELDKDTLNKVAGGTGSCYHHCPPAACHDCPMDYN